MPNEELPSGQSTDLRLSAGMALANLDSVTMRCVRRGVALPQEWVQFGKDLEGFIAGLPADGSPAIGLISDLPQPPTTEP